MASQLHHFVPRFHLKRFVDPTQKRELIWVYERGKQEPQLRSLDHVAARKDYYAFKTEDGQKSHALEDVLARIEGATAPILRRLGEGDRKLTADERKVFATFLSLGVLRTPKFRSDVEQLVVESVTDFSMKLASDPVKFAESVKSAEEALGENLGNPEELREALLNGSVKITSNPEYSLQAMFQDSFEHAAMIDSMIWSFREADEDTTLVTSDHPIVLNNPTLLEGAGPPSPQGLEVIFPISPKLVFVATWDGRAGTGPMPGFLTRQINRTIALAADRYVYSPAQIPAISKHLTEPRLPFISEESKTLVKQKMSQHGRP
jgi:hypothetical protein